MNAMTNSILVEYHGRELRVSADLLDRLDRYRNGMLFQFLGELQKDQGEVSPPSCKRSFHDQIPSTTAKICH